MSPRTICNPGRFVRQTTAEELKTTGSVQRMVMAERMKTISTAGTEGPM
jgi:hypothetical protein